MVDKIIKGRKYRIDWNGNASVKKLVENGRGVYGIACDDIKELASSRKAFVAKTVSENPARGEEERYDCRLEGELHQYYWPNCLLVEVPDKKNPDEVIVIKRYGDVTTAIIKQVGIAGERKAQVIRHCGDEHNMHTACCYVLNKLFDDRHGVGAVDDFAKFLYEALRAKGYLKDK